MRSTDNQPHPGHYRLHQGVRVVSQNGSAVAICDYPLRLVRLSSTAARILSLCVEERTCEQLAQAISIPLKRVEAVCSQLRWKGLLEVGPMLPPPAWPPVSIVIPTYNRARQLERCLRSLFALDYPCLEIIVVDDASTDETNKMLACMVEEATVRGLGMRVIRHERQQGAGISRNTGAETAQYALIAYIDSDCVASANWLKELVPAFEDERIAAVGGMIRAYERHSMLGRYEDVRSSLFMGMRSQQVFLEGPLTYLPTANLLVRRMIWQQLRGFAPLPQGEDVDFCRRLLLSGALMQYLPQGVVYHDYRITMGAFLRIRADYASAEAALLRRYPRERRILVLPPEQAMFAGTMIGVGWSLMCHALDVPGIPRRGSRPYAMLSLLCLPFAFILLLLGTHQRLQKVPGQHIPMNPLTVLKATLRSHLAYTYHFCRHLTRYYTLPLLAISLFIPPSLVLTFLMCAIVIGTDYVRLRPDLGLGEYAVCSILDDCAYEAGVVWGCVKYRTWKPLLPIIKKRLP